MCLPWGRLLREREKEADGPVVIIEGAVFSGTSWSTLIG